MRSIPEDSKHCLDGVLETGEAEDGEVVGLGEGGRGHHHYPVLFQLHVILQAFLLKMNTAFHSQLLLKESPLSIPGPCAEPVFVNVYGVQESIPPAYVAWQWQASTGYHK
jgi:hypothetical protein